MMVLDNNDSLSTQTNNRPSPPSMMINTVKQTANNIKTFPIIRFKVHS